MTRLTGLDLAHRFYLDAVRPVLDRRFPRLEHAAALIGPGSEVLGFDDETSTDHHWGPRAQVFLREGEDGAAIHAALAEELPTSFAGVPTSFGPPVDPSGSRLLVAVEAGPVDHLVDVLPLRAYLRHVLGVDALARFTVADWLVTPSERLLELTAGRVFADGTGELTRLRELLAWYPDDVWLVVMAGHWRRIAQVEHLHGRAGSRGDELGARVIAASLVRDLMRLALLQARRYPPYPKWLGTAYAALARPEANALAAALAAGRWHEREEALARAYELVAAAHNALGVTPEVDPTVRQFYGRRFHVLFADRLVDALFDAVADPELRTLGHRAGAVDAVSENTDVLTRPHLWRRLRGLYDRVETSEGSRDDGL